MAFCLLAVFNIGVSKQASAFNGDLSTWDVSAVTDMQYSAPHAISVHAHMSSSYWFLGGGLQSAGLVMCEGRSGSVCDSDSGCGVTLVEAWMVCGACVHARMMRVGMMCRGFLPFGSVLSSIGFQRRPLGVGCERRDHDDLQCAPRRISPGAYVELSLAFWVAGCKVRGWQCAEGDRGTRVLIVVVVVV